MGCDKRIYLSWVVNGEPVPAARPRVVSVHGKRLVYLPQKTRQAIEAHKWAAMAALKRRKGWPKDADYFVDIACFRSSNRRADLDNFAKVVLDGGTRAGVWNDDSQVRKLNVTKIRVGTSGASTSVVAWVDAGDGLSCAARSVGRQTDTMRKHKSQSADHKV